MSELKIGLIGLDTSHVTAFTKLLNDPAAEFPVAGAKVVCAYPGVGSPDFELSYSRVGPFTNELRDKYGIEIVDSPEAVAESSDAILLESVDGRVHLELFRRIAPYGKPIFVDKPFAVSSQDADEMVALAKQYGLPLMSCSSLRYAEDFVQSLRNEEKGAIIGIDCFGPMAIQPTQPGLFWYGIHTVEMLFAGLGKGCVQVSATSTEDHDLITGLWSDGRVGTIRGNRKGNSSFGGVLHRERGSDFIDVYANPKPYYAGLLESIIGMAQTGKEPIDLEETMEIIRFIEAANVSRETGEPLRLEK